jgi:hypothetical protein
MEMNMKIATIIFSALLPLLGCVTDSNQKLPEPKAVSTTLIKSTSIQERTIVFTVVCTTPEPCWKFVRFDNSTLGQSITTTVFAQRTTNDPCLQVLSSIEVPVTIVVPSNGTYSFRFWQYDGKTLDTTLTIP